MKKFCLCYFDLKCFFDKRLIAIDYILQNSINLVNTLDIRKDKYLVYPFDDIDSNRKDFLVYNIDDNSNSDGNRAKINDLETPRPEKADLDKQNQRISYVMPNTRYYNFQDYI